MSFSQYLGQTKKDQYEVAENFGGMGAFLQDLYRWVDERSLSFCSEYLNPDQTTAQVRLSIDWRGKVLSKEEKIVCELSIDSSEIKYGDKEFLSLKYCFYAENEQTVGTGESIRVVQPTDYYRKKGRRPL